MNGTKSILDRINNLTSDESKVLENFNNRIDSANKNKAKAEKEKQSYEKDITNIQSDIDEITKASEISDRFSNLDSYMPGLRKLGKSVTLIESLKEELNKIPEQIENLENKIKDLTDESNNRAKLIEEAEDEISKLDVELSDAKRYQDNLIELINLAKSGNINKTREEVVETLTHVGFTEKEAISAAKIILFPEDDLIPYFDKTAKEEIKNDIPEKVEEEIEEVEEQEENTEDDEELSISNVTDIDNIISSMNEEDNESPLDIDNTMKLSTFEDEESKDNEEEQNDDAPISLEEIEENEINPVSVSVAGNYEDIKQALEEIGFDSSRFNSEELNGDIDTIIENAKFVLRKDINKEIIYRYPSIIVDSDLEAKYNFILETLEKTEEDISLTPEILASYSLDDLEKLTEISSQTGINPKIIPLVVYLKGLQPFLRNYLLLKENGINLDENELSKFAIILSLNPVEFKKSLQMLLDYNVNLIKNDGKVALMDLSINDLELANKMDMLINIGEEDIIKYYPEVLTGDVKELANRLLFLKSSGIPYKTQSHSKVVYQSFVLKQEVLEKVLEKKIDLNYVLDKNETNEKAKELLQDDSLIDELDTINENFDMISSTYLEDYKNIVKIMKNKCVETENSYVIDNIHFSKNKVNRNINYLANTFTDKSKEMILLASLLYDSRLSEKEMRYVINLLKIKDR